MKNVGAASVEGLGSSSAGDGRTREAVSRQLMEQGPITAADVAAALSLSGPAVRRHIDALIADGEAEAREASTHGRRGRGRPARLYVLTPSGRARFGHGYDGLAVAALRFIAEHGGDEAVAGFARSRVEELLGGSAATVAAGAGAGARVDLLAGALTDRGYAAATRSAGNGVQLCQHHCPVAHVAAEFPALCEAETKAFAEILGTHVQRLATIARGDSACTTHVPIGHSPLDVPDVAEETTTTNPGARSGATIPRGRQSAYDDHS